MKTSLAFAYGTLFCLQILIAGCTKEAVTSSLSSSLSGNTAAVTSNFVNAQNGYTRYVIEEGNHYANGQHFRRFTGTSLRFDAVFDSSAIYDFTDIHIKYDQNTLYGFADNGQSHLNFSARFGWRWFNNKLQIAAYTFNNSVPTITQIGSVQLGVPNRFEILVEDDHYEFKLNGVSTIMPRASISATAGYYKLLPYFGGDATAPQSVLIRIKEL